MARRFTFLPLLAALVVAVPLGAQSAGGGGTVRATTRRDTVSVVRVRVSDRERVSRLRATLDSLISKVRAEPLSLTERARLEEQLTTVMVSLESVLRRAEVEAMGAREGGSATTRALLERSRVAQMQLDVMRNEVTPSVAPFRGWIGITAEGAQFKTAFRNGDVYLRYVDYPEIISVEPNSPAEHVGITKGDVLVAYDGRDVRDSDINISKLLVPDRRLRVTVNRDGDRREYTMVVAEAPQHLVARRVEFGLLGPSGAATLAPAGPRSGGAGGSVAGGASGGTLAPTPRAYAGPLPSRAEVFVVPETAPSGGTFMFRTMSGIGGATTITMDEDLAANFGVKYGVLLASVRPGTPAHRAGLRSGDVIVKAEDRPTRTLAALQRILNERGAETVELGVVRMGKTISVVWER
jgi:S1-C subfamily serine protease